MFGIQKKLTGFRMIRTCWQSFQRSNYAIAIQCCRLKTCNAAAAATIGISSRGRGPATADGASGGLSSSVHVHVPSVSASGAANGIIARKFTRSSQVYRRRDYDAEDEHAINKHFYNPLNKYLDQVDGSSEKSLEDIAREQKRKIQSAKRARAAREFNRGPEKRTLSWDAIQQIHFLRDEDPDEWSVALLAESFNVSEEVIVKVLKSKFRPSAKTKLKQDLVAAENTGYVTGGAGGNHSQALVAPVAGNRSPTGSSEGKEKKHARTSTKASGCKKVPLSETKRDDSTAILKSSPLSIKSQEQSRRAERDERNRPSHDTNRKESEEEMKHPEVEFTFGNIDFENVDSLMGQVKLKPQVFRKGRNFYNEHGEFLYRI